MMSDSLRHVFDHAHAQAVGLGFGYAGAAFVESDHDVEARIMQVERVSVALAAVADYSDGLVFDQRHVRVVLVVDLRHVVRSF